MDIRGLKPATLIIHDRVQSITTSYSMNGIKRAKEALTDFVSTDDRGQLLQDFVIGVSLFLITVGFIAAFIPTLITPFGSPGESGTAINTQRISESTLDSMTVTQDSTDYGDLDRGCVVSFMEENTNVNCVNGGQYDEPLDEFYNVRENVNSVNVSIQHLENDTVVAFEQKDAGGNVVDTVPLKRGEDLSDEESTSSLARVVQIGGDEYRLVVTVS